ncbi:MAG: leucine-rich repeat domain-containing protein [Leptolyngbyaceae cyanobacterium SM1_3_5]|nr:leucine-rich repeat domain-containing protein [Leptolyngbyaceae cyanobacterium SM1_3_5]
MQFLNLGRNCLTQLPPEIGKLQNLRSLNLSYNCFVNTWLNQAYCFTIKWLMSANWLWINAQGFMCKCWGKTRPSSKTGGVFGKLRSMSLKVLDFCLDRLASSNILNIFKVIGQLHNLEDLRLEHNGLTQLPPQLGELHSLKKLDLQDNRLRQLPPQIGRLQNLKRLVVQCNQLTQLPPEIGNLAKFENA